MNEESLSLVSALTAPTDCTVLSLGVSAELGEVWEEESTAGLGCPIGTGDRDDIELGGKIYTLHCETPKEFHQKWGRSQGISLCKTLHHLGKHDIAMVSCIKWHVYKPQLVLRMHHVHVWVY